MDSELKIKVERPEGVSQEEAENALYKALSLPREGNAHSEGFQDPAMEDIADIMNRLHTKISQDILDEVKRELDREKL